MKQRIIAGLRSQLKSAGLFVALAAVVLVPSIAMVAYAPPPGGGQAQITNAPGDSVTGKFASSTAAATSATLYAKQNTSIAVNMTAVTASSTSIVLENSVSGGATWTPIKSYSTATAVNDTIANDYGYDLFLRLRAPSIPSADTVTYALTRVIASRTVQEWFNNNGSSVFRINDVGTVTPKITATSIVGTVTGTADSATGAARAQKLTTARTIGGTSFDGTANIAVALADSSTGAARAPAGTLTGTTLKSTVTASSLTSLGTLAADLLFTDATLDIGKSGLTRPRDFFLSRNATLGGTLTFGAAASQIVPGATSISLRNNANNADNLIITDVGSATFRAGITTNNNSNFGGSLAFAQATPRIIGGATDLEFWPNAQSAVSLAITEAGKVTLSRGALVELHYAPAYSSSITPDASLGNSWTITATNGTAFTINAPTNPSTGQRITLTIRNASGGTQGAVTFNAAFKTAGYTVAANAFSASADFEYDGTNWVQKTGWINTIPN